MVSHITEKVLAYDTETSGLEERDRPFLISIADSKTEYIFDERQDPHCWEKLRPLFDDPSITWIGQNQKFDMRMVGHKGLYPKGPLVDIEVMARLVKNDYLSYSLDNQAKRALNKRKDDTVDKYIKEHNLYEIRKDFFGEERKVPRFQDVPMHIMHKYAKLDTRLTYDLFKHYSMSLSPKIHRVLENESKLTRVCFDMERHGIKLNWDYTMKAYYYESGMLEQLTEAFRELTGKEFVNSAKSLQKVLKFRLPTTSKGNPSLTDDVIDEILARADGNDIPIAELVRDIRSYDKRISTYYKPYLALAHDSEGIIHADMRQAGTRTGRFSYRDPNLQNIPKEEGATSEFVVRGCFEPRPGHVFVSMDYSQMEYRLTAAYAEETDVIKEVMNGADFHQATADMLGIKRSQAKTLNFACLYGAGPDKVSIMLGVSKLESRRLLDKYFHRLPRVEKLLKSIIRTGESRGYITNWFGRDLYADRKFCYALPNHLIQSGGSDVVKLAMVRISSEFSEVSMVLQIHDQLIFELTGEQLEYVPRIKQIMEEAFPEMNGMRLTVDVAWNPTSLAERDMREWNGPEDTTKIRAFLAARKENKNMLAVDIHPGS